MKDARLVWPSALSVPTWSFVQGSRPGLQIPYLAPAEQVLPGVPTLLDFSGGMADGCQVLRVTSAR